MKDIHELMALVQDFARDPGKDPQKKSYITEFKEDSESIEITLTPEEGRNYSLKVTDCGDGYFLCETCAEWICIDSRKDSVLRFINGENSAGRAKLRMENGAVIYSNIFYGEDENGLWHMLEGFRAFRIELAPAFESILKGERPRKRSHPFDNAREAEYIPSDEKGGYEYGRY